MARTRRVRRRVSYARKGVMVRRRNTRRRYTRRRSSKNRTVTRSLGYLLPDRVRIKHTYVTGPIALGAAAYFEVVMRGNDLYDPEVRVGGHQAFYYDQMKVLYGAFRVNASKIAVTTISAGSGAYGNHGNLFLISDQVATTWAGVFLDATTLEEQQRGKMLKWGGTGDVGNKTLYDYRKSRTILESNDDALTWGGASGGPTEQWYWHCIWKSADYSTVLGGYYNIKMTYYTEWKDRLVASGS